MVEQARDVAGPRAAVTRQVTGSFGHPHDDSSGSRLSLRGKEVVYDDAGSKRRRRPSEVEGMPEGARAAWTKRFWILGFVVALAILSASCVPLPGPKAEAPPPPLPPKVSAPAPTPALRLIGAASTHPLKPRRNVPTGLKGGRAPRCSPSGDSIWQPSVPSGYRPVPTSGSCSRGRQGPRR
jgi:hypothetical protein